MAEIGIFLKIFDVVKNVRGWIVSFWNIPNILINYEYGGMIQMNGTFSDSIKIVFKNNSNSDLTLYNVKLKPNPNHFNVHPMAFGNTRDGYELKFIDSNGSLSIQQIILKTNGPQQTCITFLALSHNQTEIMNILQSINNPSSIARIFHLARYFRIDYFVQIIGIPAKNISIAY